MKSIRIAVTAVIAAGLASSASAQLSVNCNVAGGCRVDKYGLHAPDSYGKEADPIFEITNPGDTPLARDFAGSYGFQKDTSDPNNPQCDGEGGFVPVFGQIVLREQAKNGDQCGFCMGVADLQLGDPKAIYPQIARNAEFRARAYAAWKEQTGNSAEETGGVLTKCGM